MREFGVQSMNLHMGGGSISVEEILDVTNGRIEDWQIIGFQDCGICTDIPNPDLRDAFPGRIATNGSTINRFASVMIIVGEEWRIVGPIKRGKSGRTIGVNITDGSREIFVVNVYMIPNSDNYPPSDKIRT